MNHLADFNRVPCVLMVKQDVFWIGGQVLSSGKLRIWMVYGNQTVLIPWYNMRPPRQRAVELLDWLHVAVQHLS